MIESDTIEQVQNVYKNFKIFKIFQIAFSDERTDQGRTDRETLTYGCVDTSKTSII